MFTINVSFKVKEKKIFYKNFTPNHNPEYGYGNGFRTRTSKTESNPYPTRIRPRTRTNKFSIFNLFILLTPCSLK